MQKTIYNPAYVALISRLHDRRKALNLTQEDVAQKLCVHRSWVGKIENRERRLDVIELHHLCQLYRLNWTDLEPLAE